MNTHKASPSYQAPMRQGVTASKVFLPELDLEPSSIFVFLCENFPHISKDEWRQRFEQQLILSRSGDVLLIDSPYISNTHIYYYRFLTNEIHVPFQEKIIYENDDLLVVDKPHFLTISPSGQYVQETLLVRLKQQTNNPELTPIHRLDRETAGIVLISKRKQSRAAYQQMFAQREVKKTYHAIAPFRADLVFPLNVNLRMDKGNPFYTMQVVEGVANSSTEIHLLEHNLQWAKYLLQPLTGKQHQLRVHLNSLAIPIKNDPFYPQVNHKLDDDFSQPLQLLAKEISFIDPITQRHMHFSSEKELTI